MAPKKKEQQKMSLGTFLQDEKLGSWADEMEDMPLSDSRANYAERRQYNSSSYGNVNSAGYSIQQELPLPDKPPFTVHLGNLSFEATTEDVKDFFAECECINVRIIEDRLENKPKGFGYAEFATQEGIKTALTLNGASFQGRNIRISVADPPKDRERDRPDVRDLDWGRKGPLPDLPNQRSERRGFGSGRSFGEPSEGGERRERQFQQDDGKVRDFGNWERKGPLSPIAQAERPSSSRDGRPQRTEEGGEGFRDRRASPAAWGEGRTQDGSRPPRREYERPAGAERPERPERAPTAAEQDNHWRAKMKPDSAKSPEQESAPSSPAPAAAVPAAPAPASRPRLNLAKRTVSDATNLQSPSLGESKPNPFGGARPIDTATKEKEIEEKKQKELKEKKEAEEKAREEKRLAKEAAAAKASEAAESESAAPEATEPAAATEGAAPSDEGAEKAVEGKAAEEKSQKSPDSARESRPKPAAEGSWRRPSGGPKPARGEYARGPRGDGPPRGPRSEGPRHPRANGGPAPQAAAASATSPPATPDPETAALEADGWSTVSSAKQRKNQRGNPGARAIAS